MNNLEDVVSARSLIMRAEQELEAKEWNKAAEYCNRALDAEPQNAEAWWSLFLAESEISQWENFKLEDLKEPEKLILSIRNSRNFQYALKYAQGETSKKIALFQEKTEQFAKERLAALEVELEEQQLKCDNYSTDVRSKVMEGVEKGQILKERFDWLNTEAQRLESSLSEYQKVADKSTFPTLEFWFECFLESHESGDGIGMSICLLIFYIGILAISLPIHIFCTVFITPFLVFRKNKYETLYQQSYVQYQDILRERHEVADKIKMLAEETERLNQEVVPKMDAMADKRDELVAQAKIYRDYLAQTS